MSADVPTAAELMAVLVKFSDACARRDTEGALGVFAQDDDILLVGSEAGMRSRGPEEIRAFLERLFSREKTYSWSWEWPSVSLVHRHSVQRGMYPSGRAVRLPSKGFY